MQREGGQGGKGIGVQSLQADAGGSRPDEQEEYGHLFKDYGILRAHRVPPGDTLLP
ncbi:hypothetical protein SDC9_198169 [bioreactor metagenome]|uniref:Uncharacterized protein n=1 Tax=bioreactor metagenome TaxID=1076179 RepID=A0A645II78_9ZZZZ